MIQLVLPICHENYRNEAWIADSTILTTLNPHLENINLAIWEMIPSMAKEYLDTDILENS